MNSTHSSRIYYLSTFLIATLFIQGCASTTTTFRAHRSFAAGNKPVANILVLKPIGEIQELGINGPGKKLDDFSDKVTPKAFAKVVAAVESKSYSAITAKSTEEKAAEKSLRDRIEKNYAAISDSVYSERGMGIREAYDINVEFSTEALTSSITKNADAILYVKYLGITRSKAWMAANVAGTILKGIVTQGKDTSKEAKNKVEAIALLIDTKTGKILWANNATYAIRRGHVDQFAEGVGYFPYYLPNKGMPMRSRR